MTVIYTRDWTDELTTNQTLYGNSSPTQSAVGGLLKLTTNNNNRAAAHLTDIGTIQNMDLSVNVRLVITGHEAGVIFRTNYWNNANNSFGYIAYITPTAVALGRGSEGLPATWTVIKSVALTTTPAVTRTLRVVCDGSDILVYVDGVNYITLNDTTYGTAGGVALSFYRSTGTASFVEFDNLTIDDMSELTPDIQVAGLEVQSMYYSGSDLRVAGVELQSMYYSGSDLRVSGLELQSAYYDPKLLFAGIDVQTLIVTPSLTDTCGVDVQVWVSTRQQPVLIETTGLELESVSTTPSSVSVSSLETEVVTTQPSTLNCSTVEIECVYSLTQYIPPVGDNPILFMQTTTL